MVTYSCDVPLKIMASACLCGIPCRYDGKSNSIGWLVDLYDKGLALAVCPEQEGGLATPRPPCEIHAGRVMTCDGVDVTAAFEAGAARTLELALEHGIAIAILKENSPSCGSSMVYDGSFSRCRVQGQGLTAALLRKHGIRVVNEFAQSDVVL